MPHERIKNFRERLQRREQSTRADRRAKARRVREGDPEGVSEKAQVKAREASEEAQATRRELGGLGKDARTLISTELGISSSEAESVIRQGADLLERSGDRIQSLDVDGDGDTDLLPAIENNTANDRGGGGGIPGSGFDFEGPVEDEIDRF